MGEGLTLSVSFFSFGSVICLLYFVNYVCIFILNTYRYIYIYIYFFFAGLKKIFYHPMTYFNFKIKQ